MKTKLKSMGRGNKGFAQLNVEIRAETLNQAKQLSAREGMFFKYWVDEAISARIKAILGKSSFNPAPDQPLVLPIAA